MNTPDYKRIYTDLLNSKYPEKLEEFKGFLAKESLSVLDVISLNRMLFHFNYQKENQSLRSYSKKDILKILDYQKVNNLNNRQLANHFQLSKNTIAKWKKMFVIYQS